MPSYKRIFSFGALSVFQGVTVVNAFVTPLRSNNRQSSLFVIDFLKGIIPGGGNGGSSGVESFLATEECDVCIVGGGVAGMASALTLLSEESGSSKKVTLVEASPTLGGRVQSDVTEDGYILDRGFAVFIEEYPFAKKLLDYDGLKLKRFEPGALVYTGEDGSLSKVADPLRRPGDLLVALTANVGEFTDKLRVLPLLFHVFTNTVDDLFAEPETDTLSCLKNRWGFSDKFIAEFMQPFLEGIYLAPLEEQSSRMFHFVFKMFSEGAACLPEEGMKSVAQQMESRCEENGVRIVKEKAVTEVLPEGEDSFVVKTGLSSIQAKSVIIATEGNVAEKLLSKLPGMKPFSEQTQRSVGCLYYSFESKAPVEEPILILNGARTSPDVGPVNNICFPSIVSPTYAPEGKNICSVTLLKPAMDKYNGDIAKLDETVRKQLVSWFPKEFTDDILNSWKLAGSYDIQSAQPSQLGGPSPASVTGGRDNSLFRDQKLPNGLFVCGDHMATATLNGALESGVKAGQAAASHISQQSIEMLETI